MSELEEYTIQAWRELMNKQYSSFVSIDAECSLYDGLHQLIKHKIHRLPIIDYTTGNPLYILTHKRILKFIKVCVDSNTVTATAHPAKSTSSSSSTSPPSKPLTWKTIPIFQRTLSEKPIGTYGNVYKMYE